MSWLQNGTPGEFGSVTSFDLTVPAGVTADQFVLIMVAGTSSGGTGADCVATKAGATFTTIAPTAVDNTVWGTLIKGTGLVAGDVVTVTLSVARQVAFAHSYFDNDFGVPSALNPRIDSATNIAPDIAVGPGSTVYVVSFERSTTVGTAVSSAVNSNGRTVNERLFNETLTPTLCTFYLADFGEPTASSGTTTLTYTNTSTSGLALSIEGVPAVPPDSGQITAAMTSWFGENFLRGGWVTLAGASVRMAASVNADLSGAVFSDPVVVPASGWLTTRVDGLAPDTLYHIGLEINGVLQTDGRTQARTLPVAGTEASFTVISGSCQITGSNHASLARAALENAAYLLHFGDLHYADAITETAWRNAVLASLVPSNMRALTAAFPLQWLWDNHDWGGELSWSGSPAAAWVPSAYRELTGDLPDAVGGWRTWVHGRVRFIRTDMHSQRSDPGDPDSPAKVLLGAAQKQWWKDTLEAATEPVIIWASGWPNHNLANGRWQTYTTDVDEMETWLDARPEIKARIICLGADSHDVRADSGTRPPVWQAFSGLPSLNASPFNQAGGVGETQSWDIGQIDIDDARGAYSRLTFTDQGSQIVLLWEAVFDDGTVLLDWETTFSAEEPPVPPDPRPTPSTDILADIELILDTLSDPASGCSLDPLPCHVSLYPAGEIPFDVCEVSAGGQDGQMWGAIQLITRISPSGAGSCDGQFQVTAEIGVVRCAAKPKDDGSPPTVGEISADAWQQVTDSDRIREAIRCCLADNYRVQLLELTSWTPALGGGCVGGFWTLTGVWDGCC